MLRDFVRVGEHVHPVRRVLRKGLVGRPVGPKPCRDTVSASIELDTIGKRRDEHVAVASKVRRVDGKVEVQRSVIETRSFVGNLKAQGTVLFTADVHGHVTLRVTLIAMLHGIKQEFAQDKGKCDGFVDGEGARKTGAGSHRLVDEVEFRPDAKTDGVLFDDSFKHDTYPWWRWLDLNCWVAEKNNPCQVCPRLAIS